MPGKGKKGGGPLGAVSTVRNFVGLMKELSFDEIRTASEQMPRILVVAPDADQARKLGDRLTGIAGSPAVSHAVISAEPPDFERYDAVVVHNPPSSGGGARSRMPTPRGEPKFLEYGSADLEDNAALADLRATLAARRPELAPALGRWFAAFRPAASKAVIDEAARVNAQFALVSNAPAVIPIVGSLAGAGADFFVLTKNQLMLIFKLAAIHGRDLHDQGKLIREMIPVVGAGFAWRTIAREACEFLPFAAGAIPKVAIAYSGTMAAGWAADFYYSYGRKPTTSQWRAYLADAAGAAKELHLPSLPNRERG